MINLICTLKCSLGLKLMGTLLFSVMFYFDLPPFSSCLGVHRLSLSPLRVTSILFLPTISPLKQTLRSIEQGKWPTTEETCDCSTNSPIQKIGKCPGHYWEYTQWCQGVKGMSNIFHILTHGNWINWHSHCAEGKNISALAW